MPGRKTANLGSKKHIRMAQRSFSLKDGCLTAPLLQSQNEKLEVEAQCHLVHARIAVRNDGLKLSEGRSATR
jgi:hypothetical protein